MILNNLGIKVRGTKIDTMLLHYLIDAESRHNMDFLAERYLNYQPIAIETLIGKGAKQLTMDMVGVERVAEYAAEDADITLQLKHALYPELEQLGMTELYHRIEEPMIDVLADMELTGVTIDKEALNRYAVELRELLARLEAEVREMAEEPALNINSSRQLGEVLFGKLRIADKPKMTKTKQFATDEEYLQSFAHDFPIVSKILEYRGVKKLLSTYIEPFPNYISPATGKIHTTFNQALTATGRLSSSKPNLQNIPIRTERGKEIRKAFVPSHPGGLIVSADYSQIELRIMAHLSCDTHLINAFRDGQDVHAITASKIFGVPLEEVTADQRRIAKTANFGIMYGISSFGLAQRLHIGRSEAKKIIEDYFANFPAISSFIEDTLTSARETGYVETIFGRRRYLPDINSKNGTVRSLAERTAVNAPIQGTSADIIKMAMINVGRRIESEGLKSRMVLQIHDELVFDAVAEEVETLERIVREEMENVTVLSVPLTVECNHGSNWLEAH
jgi:DNA polymerase-1